MKARTGLICFLTGVLTTLGTTNLSNHIRDLVEYNRKEAKLIELRNKMREYANMDNIGMAYSLYKLRNPNYEGSYFNPRALLRFTEEDLTELRKNKPSFL